MEKLQRESEFFKDSIHKSGHNNAHEYLWGSSVTYDYKQLI